MHDGSNNANEQNIAHYREEFADRSDANLMALADSWAGRAMGAAASQILLERSEARSKAKHDELLAEIRKPHWSVVPSFWLLVASVIFSLIAVILSAVALPAIHDLWAKASPQPERYTSTAGNSQNMTQPSKHIRRTTSEGHTTK